MCGAGDVITLSGGGRISQLGPNAKSDYPQPNPGIITLRYPGLGGSSSARKPVEVNPRTYNALGISKNGEKVYLTVEYPLIERKPSNPRNWENYYTPSFRVYDFNGSRWETFSVSNPLEGSSPTE